jgi:hypothetical protein
MRAHTCKSCSHYRVAGCALGLAGWPSIPLAHCTLDLAGWPVMALTRCPSAQWEPGADEAEDWAS